MKFLSRFVLTGMFTCAVASARSEMINAIQAVVHDSVITYLEVNALTEQTAELVISRYRGQPEVLQRELNKTREENLERQVQNQLILHEFTTAGYSLPESTLDEIFEEHLKADFGDRATATKSGA